MQYIKPKYISLQKSPSFNEKWIQNIIAEDPGILGLGTLSTVSKEKILSSGGRVDLILGDDESSVRYEVEIQLGKTDPSHIIRVLEYWDLERKRYPEFDHVAVLVAEEITSRFFNVISLFNGVIPIIALQMKCIEIDNKVTLVFSTILDSMVVSGGNDVSLSNDNVDKAVWNKTAGKEVIALINDLLSYVNSLPSINGQAELAPRKQHAVIVYSNKVIAYCIPRKNYVTVAVKLARTTKMDEFLSNSNLDVMDYNSRIGRYRVRIHINEETDFSALVALIESGLSNDQNS